MHIKSIGAVVFVTALSAFAAHPQMGPRPGHWDEGREREGRLRMVVALSEALELNEADALKLSEQIKGLEQKRRPLRMQMGEAMRALKDAADGNAAAQAAVDANIQLILDGRAQMAALDKELFAGLSQGLSPQKRAKLALTLAGMHHEMKGMKHRARFEP